MIQELRQKKKRTIHKSQFTKETKEEEKKRVEIAKGGETAISTIDLFLFL